MRGRWQRWRQGRALRARLRDSRPRQVVLGAGGTAYPGWISTDREVLDLTAPADWARWFAPGSIDRLLAEHVFEHLTVEQNRQVLRACAHYLRPGGVLRVAVPDGWRDDPVYRAEVAPPKDGHQCLFEVDSLSALLREAGFEVTPLEYFDREGRFHAVPWDPAEGLIQRSARFDRQAAFQRDGRCYTSLIIDARRPAGT